MANQDNFERVTNSVIERFNSTEITRRQAKEEILELILASKTVAHLELAHYAFDKVAEASSYL